MKLRLARRILLWVLAPFVVLIIVNLLMMLAMYVSAADEAEIQNSIETINSSKFENLSQVWTLKTVR